ncbi:hypothetical protein MMC34_001457 [Xylographa carneopallida]|nr:hypothetical protein [Xylographa carneopallida]
MSGPSLGKVYVYIVTTLLDSEGGEDFNIQAVFEDLEDANYYAKAWLGDIWSLDEDSFEEYQESHQDDGTLVTRAVEGEGDVFEIRVVKKECRTARKAQKS